MTRENDIKNQAIEIANTDCSTDEKLIRILQLGCEHFGLMLGLISEIDGASYFVKAAYPDGLLSIGERFDLEETICESTRKDKGIVCFPKASGTDWVTHPAYEKFSIEAYIGVAYSMDGNVAGTLNFSSPTAITKDFLATDKKIIQQLAETVTEILTASRQSVHPARYI
ncbi:hypothetical protein RYZ26_05075 [Terasakiella sp. A23]|uniref:GAF domain-containing protein n=1 Tax=Terasakiella sp. FCG-A23 TaxID=3080561 RepID=UPI0029535777|nr:hypothetical protein [Terasakiella sp. A23]MDV7338952.1 hypothetical protein [Terasakiella sp. A23]